MRIECNVDGKALSLTVNSIKPLSLILMESCDVPSLKLRGKALRQMPRHIQ